MSQVNELLKNTIEMNSERPSCFITFLLLFCITPFLTIKAPLSAENHSGLNSSLDQHNLDPKRVKQDIVYSQEEAFRISQNALNHAEKMNHPSEIVDELIQMAENYLFLGFFKTKQTTNTYIRCVF